MDTLDPNEYWSGPMSSPYVQSLKEEDSISNSILEFRDKIIYIECDEVLRIDDEKGREYIYDGTELYRCIPLKGKKPGRKKSDGKGTKGIVG